ncbi:MAG: FecR family protein [Cyclobacteriaceae bacterium]|nr:FecR family protein [Cyclobacteriaceae bacterium]
MKYSNYKLDNFLKDEYFRSWVICPNEESDFFWSSFLKNNPYKYATIIKAKEVIFSFTSPKLEESYLKNEEIESMLSKVLDVGNRSKEGNQMIKHLTWNFNPRIITRAAVFLFIITFIGLAWITNQFSQSAEQAQIIKSYKKSTLKGEKMTVRLPDNSVVVLNSGSLLEYPEFFSDSERKIKLTGEAFLNVSKDINRPLIIESDQFVTQVKGTSFAIKKMDECPTIEVSVVTGKVKVAHVVNEIEVETIEIVAQQMASFNGTNKFFKKSKLDYNEKIAWRDGTIYFNNSDFNEIVHRLENWYGVNITIIRSIDRKKDFSGHFTNENLDLVLNGLSFTYDFNYKINGKEVIIK